MARRSDTNLRDAARTVVATIRTAAAISQGEAPTGAQSIAWQLILAAADQLDAALNGSPAEEAPKRGRPKGSRNSTPEPMLPDANDG